MATHGRGYYNENGNFCIDFSNQNNMSEFKITKERILAAANKCGTAKATLETLFPEAFEKEWKKIGHFSDVYKDGKKAIVRSMSDDCDIWIPGEFNLVYVRDAVTNGKIYRLESK